MTYAAALVLGLALIWIGWAPLPAEPSGWIAAGVAIVVAFIAALSMRIVDRESAPYFRTPFVLALATASVRRMAAVTIDLAKRAFASDPRLHPALVHFRTRELGDNTRAAFANLAALSSGAIVVDSQDDALLLHVLIEEDADEIDLRDLETRAEKAAG